MGWVGTQGRRRETLGGDLVTQGRKVAFHSQCQCGVTDLTPEITKLSKATHSSSTALFKKSHGCKEAEKASCVKASLKAVGTDMPLTVLGGGLPLGALGPRLLHPTPSANDLRPPGKTSVQATPCPFPFSWETRGLCLIFSKRAEYIGHVTRLVGQVAAGL